MEYSDGTAALHLRYSGVSDFPKSRVNREI